MLMRTWLTIAVLLLALLALTASGKNKTKEIGKKQKGKKEHKTKEPKIKEHKGKGHKDQGLKDLKHKKHSKHRNATEHHHGTIQRPVFPEHAHHEPHHKYRSLNFTIGPLKLHRSWIRRAGQTKDGLYPIWYAMTGHEGTRNHYIRANYNASNGKVHAFGAPCGPIPSRDCTFAMLQDLVKIKLTFNVSDPMCVIRMPVPVLYNLPRWTVQAVTKEHEVMETDSMTLSAAMLSIILTRYLRRESNLTCTRHLIPAYALYKNYFNVTTTPQGVIRLLEGIHQLQLNKQHSIGGIWWFGDHNHTYTHTTLVKFYEYFVFLYATLYASTSLEEVNNHVQRTVNAINWGIHTEAGMLRLYHLLRQYVNRTPIYGEVSVSLQSMTNIDALIIDYLDTFAMHGAKPQQLPPPATSASRTIREEPHRPKKNGTHKHEHQHEHKHHHKGKKAKLKIAHVPKTIYKRWSGSVTLCRIARERPETPVLQKNAESKHKHRSVEEHPDRGERGDR